MPFPCSGTARAPGRMENCRRPCLKTGRHGNDRQAICHARCKSPFRHRRHLDHVRHYLTRGVPARKTQLVPFRCQAGIAFEKLAKKGGVFITRLATHLLDRLETGCKPQFRTIDAQFVQAGHRRHRPLFRLTLRQAGQRDPAPRQDRGDPGRFAGSGTGGLTHATGSGSTVPRSRCYGKATSRKEWSLPGNGVSGTRGIAAPGRETVSRPACAPPRAVPAGTGAGPPPRGRQTPPRRRTWPRRRIHSTTRQRSGSPATARRR